MHKVITWGKTVVHMVNGVGKTQPVLHYPSLTLHLPCPYTLSYCTLPSPPLPSPPISCLLPPPFIPFPSIPNTPISFGLPCSTQRFRKSQRPRCFGTRMYRGRNCLVQNVFWRTEMTLSLKGPGNVKGRNVLGPNRLWTDLYFCVIKCLGRNGFHVMKRPMAEMVWYLNVLLPSYNNTLWTSPQRIQCKPIYK